MYNFRSLKKTVFLFFIAFSFLLTSCNFDVPSSQTAVFESDGNLTVHFMDVGQADAILIQLPGGENMLIDAGNNSDGPLITAYLKEQGVEKIHYLIGTHPHEDHIGAMDDIIYNFDIETFYMPRVTHNTKTFEDVLLAADEKGLQIHTAKAGVTLFETESHYARFISPNSDQYSGLNDYSAVILLGYGNTTFLFTGDAESYAEAEMLTSGYHLKADVLKVGHHGSDTSTTEDFLQAVSPAFAVISCGTGNSYGHPSQDTLDKLDAQQIQLYRTDLQGTVVAASDGTAITFSTAPAPTGGNNAEPAKSQATAAPVDVLPDEPPAVTAPVSLPESTEEEAPPPAEAEPAETLSAAVYITDSGTKYHTEDCSYLNTSKKAVALEDALQEGYGPCSRCKPPQ